MNIISRITLTSIDKYKYCQVKYPQVKTLATTSSCSRTRRDCAVATELEQNRTPLVLELDKAVTTAVTCGN